MNCTVIYHAHCNDGSASALVAYIALRDVYKQITYLPMNYGELPENEDVIDRDIYILDFSFPAETLTALADIANAIMMIDHHKTADEHYSEEVRKQLPDNVQIHIDRKHCGAVLTWKHFFPEQDHPMLLSYIEDNDLWLHQLEDTRAIQKALQLHPDFRSWESFLSMPGLRTLIAGGRAIQEFTRIKGEEMLDQITPANWMDIGIVPVLNLPKFMMSDVLNLALERFPESPFAVGYTLYNDRCEYSLRSSVKGANTDVSFIAKTFGGGGHHNAAGFVLNKQKMQELKERGRQHSQAET